MSKKSRTSDDDRSSVLETAVLVERALASRLDVGPRELIEEGAELFWLHVVKIGTDIEAFYDRPQLHFGIDIAITHELIEFPSVLIYFLFMPSDYGPNYTGRSVIPN